jgi:hypothetical protein
LPLEKLERGVGYTYVWTKLPVLGNSVLNLRTHTRVDFTKAPALRYVMTTEQKITFGEMRASGVRDVDIYCRDHRCSHHVETNADGWREKE